MKIKTLLAAAVLGVATAAQATNVMWGSGFLNTAANENGGWSETLIKDAGVTVTMNLYIIKDVATYNSLAGASQKTMYDWSLGQTATASAQNQSGFSVMTISQGDASGDYYAILTATYTDAKYGEMYMAQSSHLTVQAGGGDVEQTGIFGPGAIGSSAGVSNWQAAAIPEPTSALLLLFGLAGLALRRNRRG